jgi:hypothetical protein
MIGYLLRTVKLAFFVIPTRKRELLETLSHESDRKQLEVDDALREVISN